MDKTSSPRTADMAPRRGETGTQARVFPPDSPVDVPNLPPPAGDEARDADQRPADTETESSWADNTQPAPRKKNVRTSNIF
jgi:hypothetical protein